MQNSGTLSDLPLAGILETVQKDRATGTLRLTSGRSEATLYFLFGHLFHAVDADRSGEEVVFDALEWDEGDFTFDAKAKLPAEESVKISTAELLAARPGGAAKPPPAATGGRGDAQAEPAHAGDADGDPGAGTRADALDPEPTPAPVAVAPARGPRSAAKPPETRPTETMQLFPVPLGKLIYESLTAGFVDFPKLLRSLDKDAHTGYVRLFGDDFAGLMLFAGGNVVLSTYDESGSVSTGREAFDRFGARIDAGEGAIDVMGLTTEMVTALYQLLTAPSLYERLLARFTRADALLEHLTESGASGAVIVKRGEEVGVVLLRDGEILGSYTDSSREISEQPTKVLELCSEPQAEIEVRGGPAPDQLRAESSEPTAPPAARAAKGSRAATPPADRATESPPDVAPPPSPAPTVEPEPEPEPAPTAPSEPEVDWSERINQMAAIADDTLGTRAKKVKEILFAAGQSRSEVDAAIDRIAELSIMFVDPAKLTALAEEMREVASG